MSPILVDIGFVVVVVLSCLIGAYRGFVRSLLSVLSWVVAGWVTWKFGAVFEFLLSDFDLGPAMQTILTHLGVFFIVLFLMSVLSHILAGVMSSDALAGVDRTLGAAFGVVRGVVITLIIAVAGAYALGFDEPIWQESFALPILEPWVQDIQSAISQFGSV